MQIYQAEASHTERKCRSRRREQATLRGNATIAGGNTAHREEMQIQPAEARHKERKCRFSGGGKAHGEDMQTQPAEAKHSERKCRFIRRM